MSNPLEKLRQARMSLKSRNTTGVKGLEQIDDLFKEAQSLIEQMNKDKLAALKEVEDRYKPQISELDTQLAVLVELIG